jgi:hypothetical protein
LPNQDGFPTASEVVAHMNGRFEALGLDTRITNISVLPYTNPMWLANWDIPQLEGVVDAELLESELREARWAFPQVVEDHW